jgi:hypothetical protein
VGSHFVNNGPQPQLRIGAGIRQVADIGGWFYTPPPESGQAVGEAVCKAGAGMLNSFTKAGAGK